MRHELVRPFCRGIKLKRVVNALTLTERHIGVGTIDTASAGVGQMRDFIISTCRSTRHADATADELSKKLKKLGLKSPTPEGRPKCDWVIVDAGSVIVHLFKKETREIYNLEQLWEINFESEKNKLAN